MTSLGVAVTKFILGRNKKIPAPNRLDALVLLAYAAGALIAALGVTIQLTIIPLLPLAAAATVLALYQRLIRRQASA